MARVIGLHRPEGVEREKDDYYATHPSTVLPLLKILGWFFGKTIYENACGEGYLSRELEKYGNTVISTDLIDRGYGAGGVDFLEDNIFDTFKYDAIITNPPYKILDKFIMKSLKIAPLVCFFLPINKLEGIERYKEIYSKYPPKIIAVFIARQKCVINGEFDNPDKNKNTKCYAWFIWERDFKGDPVIKFI